jgi:hypothetical protein
MVAHTNTGKRPRDSASTKISERRTDDFIEKHSAAHHGYSYRLGHLASPFSVSKYLQDFLYNSEKLFKSVMDKSPYSDRSEENRRSPLTFPAMGSHYSTKLKNFALAERYKPSLNRFLCR